MTLLIILLAVALAVVMSAVLVIGSGNRRRTRARQAAPVAPRAPLSPPAPLPAPLSPPAGAVAAPPLEAPALGAPEEAVVSRPVLRERLGRARGLLSGYFEGIRSRKGIDEATFEQLEEALILADVGVATTTRVLDDLRSRLRDGTLSATDPPALLQALQADLTALFDGDVESLEYGEGDGPTVWLFVGVNGVGKTTTIGKLALREMQTGRGVVLAAGDTFRAAAGEQLETWAERAGARIVRGSDGADPSSVIFDAVQHAAARGSGLVLADTAGRLHTKVNLMEELRKVRRVAERPPGQLTEVLLVLDATTGQNGVVQARQFTEAVGVTGIVLTKLDGTAKGGVVLAIRSELGLPIKLVGVGEGPADLVPFDPVEFVAALFG
jgi:fused signal recognition particle receptor